MTPNPPPLAPVPCPECVRLGRIDTSDGLYKTHEHMQAAKFFPCGVCRGTGMAPPAPVPTQLDQIREDRDVAEPFFARLLQRAREKHPGEDIRMEDISIKVEIRIISGVAAIYRLLDDIVKEGIAL